MAVKNVGGHGVTSVLGKSDHAVAYTAQPNFPGGGGMTDSQASANPNLKANLPGGPSQKKNSTFPPAR